MWRVHQLSKITHPTIYKDADWELFLETHPYYGLFIHANVYNWSKSKLKHFYYVWYELLDQLKDKGFNDIHAAIMVDDVKLKKFADLFGFVDTGVRSLDTDKNEREIYRCSI